MDKIDREKISREIHELIRQRYPRSSSSEIWFGLIELVLDESASKEDLCLAGASLGTSRGEGDMSLASLIEEFSVSRCVLDDYLASLSCDLEGHRVIWSRVRRSLDEVFSSAVSSFAAVWSTRVRRDVVTGLGDRAAFETVLADEVERAKRYGTSFSLLLFDLDDFKKINDGFGHLEGDRVLSEVARTITDTLRRSDKVYRYGGDEFAAICFGERGIAAAISRIESRLEVGISSGIACFPADATEGTMLVKIADQRLYECKRRHRKDDPSSHSVRL
jgi:diguanylate cyclase (GGDEF)-like protein